MLNFIYGKSEPDKILIEHLIDTGCTAIELLSCNTFRSTFDYLFYSCKYTNKSKSNFLNWIAFMISLHDIGKCDIKFQCILPTKEKFCNALGENRIPDLLDDMNFRHEIYGAEIIENFFIDRNYNKELSNSIRIHHQKINAKHHPEMQYSRWKSFYKKQEEWQKEIIDKLKIEFSNPDEIIDVSFENSSTWWSLFSGLLILSDWIASSSDYVVINDLPYISNSRATAKKLIKKFGLDSESEMSEALSFEECFGIDEKSMRDIQVVCSKNIPYSSQIVIIEAATGEGKTEAALYMAYKMCAEQKKSGVYVGLPTSATSNQMYERVKKSLHSKGNIKLIHSNAWLMEESAFFESKAEDAINWMSSTKKSILCQNAVGTIDQVLKSVMRVKYSMLKILGLENKVVIIDEIHAYDSYMKSIIKRMLQWFKELHIPVILLSATLPDRIKKEYLSVYTEITKDLKREYPLITYVDNNKMYEMSCKSFKKEHINLIPKPILGNYQLYAEVVVEKAKEKGYVCCICNTVEAALKTHENIKKTLPSNTQLFLLHSKFTMEDRNKLEKKLTQIFSKQGVENRPSSCILVSTQIVEQSLDFDFDYMFTEIAPIDLLLQRIGREKRFGLSVKRSSSFLNEIKEATIFIPENQDFGKLTYIYYNLLLHKTMELVNRKETIKVPEDIRSLINQVYDNILDKKHLEAWSSMYTNEKLKEMYATSSIIPEPDSNRFFLLNSKNPVNDYCIGEDDTYTTTRMGSESIQIAFIDKEDDVIEAEMNFYKAKDLYLKSISINTYGKEIETKYIEGKGFVKNLICIISELKEIKIGNVIYKYDTENGLKKI